MKILVTGGYGFIGSRLVDYYVSQNINVTVVEMIGREKRPQNQKAKYLIISDIHEIENLIENEKPQVINHHLFLSMQKAKEGKDINIKHQNLLLVKKIISSAEKIKCKQLIFPSTLLVYGTQKNILLDEHSPKNPSTLYAEIKSEIEDSLLEYSKKSNTIVSILRYGNVYGPMQLGKKKQVIEEFIAHKISNNHPKIIGSGEQLVDFIYIDDVVKANGLIVDYPQNKILNISSGESLSINKLWEIISHHDTKHSKKNMASDKIVSVRSAEKLINWKPTVDLETGLKSTIMDMKFYNDYNH